jgi:hypothetical protein
MHTQDNEVSIASGKHRSKLSSAPQGIRSPESCHSTTKNRNKLSGAPQAFSTEATRTRQGSIVTYRGDLLDELLDESACEHALHGELVGLQGLEVLLGHLQQRHIYRYRNRTSTSEHATNRAGCATHTLEHATRGARLHDTSSPPNQWDVFTAVMTPTLRNKYTNKQTKPPTYRCPCRSPSAIRCRSSARSAASRCSQSSAPSRPGRRCPRRPR